MNNFFLLFFSFFICFFVPLSNFQCFFSFWFYNSIYTFTINATKKVCRSFIHFKSDLLLLLNTIDIKYTVVIYLFIFALHCSIKINVVISTSLWIPHKICCIQGSFFILSILLLLISFRDLNFVSFLISFSLK